MLSIVMMVGSVGGSSVFAAETEAAAAETTAQEENEIAQEEEVTEELSIQNEEDEIIEVYEPEQLEENREAAAVGSTGGNVA